VADEGEAGIAHAGKLAKFEAEQIETYAREQRDAINAAMGWTSDSGDDNG
jgi:hypothetical protein